MRLPGARLLAFAGLFIDPPVVARVLEPLVADWQREWITSGTMARRAMVRARGTIAFIGAATCCAIADGLPPDVARSAWATSARFVGLGTVAGMGANILFIPYAGESAAAILYLVPSTVTLAVAFAVLPLAMRLGGSTDRRRGRRAVVRVALAAALIVFVLQNWIAPHANQAFRAHASFRIAEEAGRTASHRPPRRGLRELTPLDLLSIASGPPVIASFAKVNEELHSRATLPLVPVALATLGWSLARASRATGAWRVAGWWIVAAVTYGAWRDLGMAMERAWYVPRAMAAWLPLVLWFLASVALLRHAAKQRARQA